MARRESSVNCSVAVFEGLLALPLLQNRVADYFKIGTINKVLPWVSGAALSLK
jgi:hypothetical protein